MRFTLFRGEAIMKGYVALVMILLAGAVLWAGGAASKEPSSAHIVFFVA
jgi:hypothetical protein